MYSNRHTHRSWLVMLLAVIGLVLLAPPQPIRAADDAEIPPDQQVELMRKVSPSLVRVQYELQFDKGEAPYGSSWSTRCPVCGQYHTENIDTLVPEERPAQIAGFLVAPDLVVTADFPINPRFLKKTTVVFGDEVVGAKFKACFTRQNAMLLQLDKPIAGTKALEFDSTAVGPYQGLVHINTNAQWQLSLRPLSMSLTTLRSGYQLIAVPSQCLIFPASANGKPVAMSMTEELDPQGKWKTSPLNWDKIEAGDLEKKMAQLGEQANRSVLHVLLSLRSPRPAAAGVQRFTINRDNDQATERHALALLAGPNTLLILDQMRPATTARLERITVSLPDGKTATAKFAGTLKDYGAMVATLDSPLEGAVTLSDADLLDIRNHLLFEAEVRLQGDTRTVYTGRQRSAGFRMGWREQLYPVYPAVSNKNRFVFDESGKLISLPIIRREKGTTPDGAYRTQVPEDTGARYIAQILANPQQYYDPANVPLNGEQENRLAWLGVELQALTPDLARANNVAALTRDGQTGVLVTYVYPDSPMAKARIEPGAVLLRVQAPGQPRPTDIRADRYPYAEQPFPWDRYDSLSEQYFDQIPRPWPSVETELSRALTDIGLGNSFELEYAVDGKSQRKQFEVEQSPAHFDTATRWKSDTLGMTVREMTYEVRRYFQQKNDDPGIIISKIESGSRASKAGLKPYEYVTHVNDQPVKTTADFERLTKDVQDLQFSVRRNTRGRVVKITLDPPPTTKAASIE